MFLKRFPRSQLLSDFSSLAHHHGAQCGLLLITLASIWPPISFCPPIFRALCLSSRLSLKRGLWLPDRKACFEKLEKPWFTCGQNCDKARSKLCADKRCKKAKVNIGPDKTQSQPQASKPPSPTTRPGCQAEPTVPTEGARRARRLVLPKEITPTPDADSKLQLLKAENGIKKNKRVSKMLLQGSSDVIFYWYYLFINRSSN